MHRIEYPWPEVGQLCGSEPFRLFCKSPLPTDNQRVICEACGLETDEAGHHMRCPSSSRPHHMRYPEPDQFGDPLAEYDRIWMCR